MKELVVVAGAGASHELGLPVGSKLKTSIADLVRLGFDDWGSKLTSGDWLICEALRAAAQEQSGSNSVNAYWNEVHHIADAMPQAYSIDHFINDQRGNKSIELCGKLGIARAILKHERGSSIFLKNERAEPQLDFSRTESTWLNQFARLITQGCTLEELPGRFSRVSLIVFNYDRCIEHFLHNWLQVYYRVDQRGAADLIESLQILHPYGTVGCLPWQKSESVHVPFGADVSPADLLAVSRQIKTFTEGTDPNASEICAIRRCIAEARRILFLGFAYYDLNLDLLQPENQVTLPDRSVFGTSLGISDFDQNAIASELAHRLKASTNSVHLQGVECHKIFGEYSRGISFQ